MMKLSKILLAGVFCLGLLGSMGAGSCCKPEDTSTSGN
jgi:hypothetical protein